MMTGKERWQAVLAGEASDRLMFWPKLFGKGYAMAQKAPFNTMDNLALYDYMETDFMEYLRGGSTKFVFHNGSRLDVSQKNGILTFGVVTELGNLDFSLGFDPVSQSYHPVHYPIADEEDFAIATRFFDDMDFDVNPEGLAIQKAHMEQVGDKGIGGEMIGESPLMAFIEYFAGVENGHYLLADYEDEIDALFDSMQRMYKRRMEIVCNKSHADILIFTENTSSTLISPTQYARYCKGHVQAYNRWMGDCGKPLLVHMCGKLNAMLDDLADLDAPVFEALTSAPIGDITLGQVKRKCTKQKCLIGGGNAVLWTNELPEIKEQIGKTVADLPDRRGVVYSSGGVIPSQCSPETLREVARFVHSL